MSELDDAFFAQTVYGLSLTQLLTAQGDRSRTVHPRFFTYIPLDLSYRGVSANADLKQPTIGGGTEAVNRSA